MRLRSSRSRNTTEADDQADGRSPPAWFSVSLGPVRLGSPIVTAAGTFGLGSECLEALDTAWIGAFTTKSLSPYPWGGNPPPRVRAAPAGMLNSVGLDNPGVEEWTRRYYPGLRDAGVVVIASVWGRSPREFAEAAAAVAELEAVSAVELNLSCPNLERPEEMVAQSPEAAGQVVAEVARAVQGTGKPVFAKLSPGVASMVPVASAVLEAGATVLTVGNTVPALELDPHTGEPRLGGGRCGLSGPAIKPIALRHVFDVAKAFPDVGIVGTGGVFNGCDALEMLRAGASAVGVGTASFLDPRAPEKIARELCRLLARASSEAFAQLRTTERR